MFDGDAPALVYLVTHGPRRTRLAACGRARPVGRITSQRNVGAACSSATAATAVDGEQPAPRATAPDTRRSFGTWLRRRAGATTVSAACRSRT
jgi:hypothetical protein